MASFPEFPLTRRSVQIQINLEAIRHNLEQARELAQSRLFAVMKADAYGHGAVRVALALDRADGFAVVSTGEAVQLREAGVRQPILVFQGPQSPQDCNAYLDCDLWPVIHDTAQYQWFSEMSLATHLKAWLKVDTGMGRLGISLAESSRLLCESVAVQWQGVLSHLACADEPGNAHTQSQINNFNSMSISPEIQKSLANSAAIIAWPETRADWARPGIMLYGSNPLQSNIDYPATEKLTLKPAMTVRAPLVSVKTLAAGSTVGYARSYTCSQSMRVGYAGIGYGDGLPRDLADGATVMIDGARCPIIGRVSMDSIAIDLRHAPQAIVGDNVVLWGPEHPVELMANAASTLSYEMLTAIRGNREYVN